MNIRLIHIIRQKIKYHLLKFGILVLPASSSEKLNNFFSLINPVETDKKLVRLGDAADGGYLVPNDLDGICACFSPGVSHEASFELALAQLGIKSYLADYSVESSPVEHHLLDFEKRYLGAKNDDIYMTLESWIQKKESLHSDSYILQMDIEGAEYEVLYQTPVDVLRKFRIMIIEFHSLGMIFSPGGYELVNLTFNKILEDFDIVHIHPNNVCEPLIKGEFSVPPVMEFSFLRKDRVLSRQPNKNFPHRLDVKNFLTRRDVVLPSCWQGK
jgi:hypothetical protein